MGGSLDMCVLGFSSGIWMDAPHLYFFCNFGGGSPFGLLRNLWFAFSKRGRPGKPRPAIIQLIGKFNLLVGLNR